MSSNDLNRDHVNSRGIDKGASDEMSDDANDAVGQLLRKAGRRLLPSEVATRETYNVVHAAWTFEQRGRSRFRFAALAAGVTAVATFGMWMLRPQIEVSSVARITQSHGSVVHLHGAQSIVATDKDSAIVEGDELYSAANSRAVLQRPSGLNIVVGANTRVRFSSRDSLRLISGVLYVDTGVNASGDPFSVATDSGVIRHVGTQFTVVARDGEVRIAVREGSVRLQSHDRVATVVHGEQALLLKDGELFRDQVSEATGAWNWVVSDTSQFAIEERSLFAVLSDIADASGMQVNYASGDVESEAKQLKLHGPVLSLEPTAALNAVLLTTQLTAERTPQEVLIKAR